MNQAIVLTYEFVKSIPEQLEERTLYVSMDYATVVHKCCCGCGREVVTPLSLTDWKLTYDGVSISLFPSIGNWNFKCKSHYWIEKSTAKWADQWSNKQIKIGRAHDRRAKKKYHAFDETSPKNDEVMGVGKSTHYKSRNGLWSWLLNWWSR